MDADKIFIDITKIDMTFYFFKPLDIVGPNGVTVPSQVTEKSKHTFGVEFSPRIPGEHRISVLLRKGHVPGSPYSCKVYDLSAIKVKDTSSGTIGKPVTFLGENLAKAITNS